MLQDDNYRRLTERRAELQNELVTLQQREDALRGKLHNLTPSQDRQAQVDALIQNKEGKGEATESADAAKSLRQELQQVVRAIPVHRQALEKLDLELQGARNEAASEIREQAQTLHSELTRRRMVAEIRLARMNQLEVDLFDLFQQLHVSALVSSAQTPKLGVWRSPQCLPRLRLAELERVGILSPADVKAAVKTGEQAPLLG